MRLRLPRDSPPSLNVLHAAFLIRNHLARVAQIVGVKDQLRIHLKPQILGTEHEGHEVDLFNADAMLAANTPAELDAAPYDGFARLNHALHNAGNAVIEVEAWMQIAIPGMKNVGDAEVVLLRYRVNGLEHFRQFGAGDHSIVGDDGRRKPPHRADALLSHPPSFFALLFVGCLLYTSPS